jgi:hypothetical protein
MIISFKWFKFNVYTYWSMRGKLCCYVITANPNPNILAYKEGYTSVHAVVASTSKIK